VGSWRASLHHALELQCAASTGVREELPHGSLVKKFAHLIIAAVVCFGALAGFLVWIGAGQTHTNLPLLLFLSGSSGAVVGNYQRLSKIAQEKEPTQDYLSGALSTIQLYIAPLIGGVFALVLWTCFASGPIKGQLFPDIQGADAKYPGNLHVTLIAMLPNSIAGAMKGGFWCFLAG